MSEARLKRTISSALWSAYADALGFPTELASDKIIHQRLGHSKVTRTEQWKRVVGGRFGARVPLPAGAYSDDTQLRLATSRAISGNGYFDVEAFAKIELPVWQSYALGAGRGSKAAASALCNRSNNWFSNFFPGYENGGGNGAAMRVQPHVWAAVDLKNKASYLTDVIRNALCTHGHMRGIAGAVVHAASLAYVFETGGVPSPEDWLGFGDDIRTIPQMIAGDTDLATFWVSMWEQKSGQKLHDAVDEVAGEWEQSVRNAVEIINSSVRHDSASLYAEIVKSENGLSREERGSGLKCALFANVAAFLGRRLGSQEIIGVVANLLDSDTDTIGTMAGALIGAANPEARYLGPVQDEECIRAEAERLYHLSQGRKVFSFKYPDMLYWQPPRAMMDLLTSSNNSYTLEGLGQVSPIGKPYSGSQKNTAWQWFKLASGQSLLVRFRAEMQPGSTAVAGLQVDTVDMFDQSNEPDDFVEMVGSPRPSEVPPSLPNATDSKPAAVKELVVKLEQGIDLAEDELERIGVQVSSIDLDYLTSEAIKGFDPQVIGRHLLLLAEQPNAISLSIAYTSIVVKARAARLKHNNRR